MLGKLVDAVRQQRDRHRPARLAARRVNGDVDRIGELLTFPPPLLELVLVGAPHVRIGVTAQIALAIEQDRRRAAQQELFDQAERERRLT